MSGYKHSEAGVIPNDWDVDIIENVAQVTTRERNTQDKIEDGSYPFFVRSQTIERINSYSYDGEAVLTAGDGVGTGKIFHYINGKFEAHQRVYRIYNFSNRVNGYLFYLYFSENFFNRIMQMTAKSSVDSVRKDMITRMSIPFPTNQDEQQSIVSAFKDIDELIIGLKKIIKKKLYIKQSIMQKLLTGKRRLPGFHSKWTEEKLGDLLTYEQPTRYLVKNKFYNDENDTPVLTPGKTFILGYTDELFGIFSNIPVIIFDDFTTATKYVDFPFKIKSSAIKILKPKNNSVNLKFIYEQFQLIKFTISDHKRHWISDYQELKFKIPQDIEEQTAIANIFIDIDFEITELQNLMNKTQDLKKGMSQQLLTGKMRFEIIKNNLF